MKNSERAAIGFYKHEKSLVETGHNREVADNNLMFAVTAANLPALRREVGEIGVNI